MLAFRDDGGALALWSVAGRDTAQSFQDRWSCYFSYYCISSSKHGFPLFLFPLCHGNKCECSVSQTLELLPLLKRLFFLLLLLFGYLHPEGSNLKWKRLQQLWIICRRKKISADYSWVLSPRTSRFIFLIKVAFFLMSLNFHSANQLFSGDSCAKEASVRPSVCLPTTGSFFLHLSVRIIDGWLWGFSSRY